MKVVVLLLGLTWAVFAQNLHLDGTSSQITFGNTRKAILKTSCEGEVPHATWMTPTLIDHLTIDETAAVKVHLRNVAPFCAESAIDSPCAASQDEEDYPRLFYCNWSGAGGSVTTGPFHAEQSVVSRSERNVEHVKVFVICSLPLTSAIMDASSYPGSGDVTLDLTVSHFAPSGQSALDVPFRGLPAGNQITIRNLPAPPPPSPPPPSIPPMSPPPSPPPPMSPPPPPQTPVCTSIALLLINNQERRDYASGFWSAESTVGDWNPNDCEEAYSWGNSDVKTEAYWTRPIGTQITLVARGDEGVFLGKAVYSVLPDYQGMTLKELLTGPADTVFTSTKESGLSSGDLRSTLQHGDHGGGAGGSTSRIGDMFIDFDNALVANSASGFGSERNQNRLTTTYGKVSAEWSNGHVFGGLGGSHVQSGWGVDYESQPMSPYCSVHNMYGSRSSGIVVSNGQTNMPFQDSCFTVVAGKSHHVDFGIYIDTVKGQTQIAAPPPPPPSPPPPPMSPCYAHIAMVLVNDQQRRDYASGFWSAESTVGDFGPVFACKKRWNEDVKTEAYWTQPIGTKVMIVARGDEGVFLGKAVYSVLPDYQGMTLKELLTGPADTVFTSTKESGLSSGDLRSTLQHGDHGGGAGGSTSRIGDMFIDFDNALVANSASGFGSERNQNRLTTTYGKVSAGWSNGHVFGGLGGSHVQSGWGVDYESQPMSPYCSVHNMYGSRSSGIVVSNGQSAMPFQDSCFTVVAGKSHHVDFGIYVDAADVINDFF